MRIAECITLHPAMDATRLMLTSTRKRKIEEYWAASKKKFEGKPIAVVKPTVQAAPPPPPVVVVIDDDDDDDEEERVGAPEPPAPRRRWRRIIAPRSVQIARGEQPN